MHHALRGRLAALLVLGLLLAACRGPGAASAATVNGIGIPRELVERVVLAQAAAQPSDGDAIPNVGSPANETTERTFMTLFIRVEIVRQLAENLGILVADEDIQGRWEVDAAARPGGEDDLRAFIESLGLTEAEYRDFELGNAARIEGIEESVTRDVVVTDEEIATAFAESGGPVASASHILVATEQEALDLKARLDAGESFLTLAAENSLDQGSAQLGGSLGQQTRGAYVAPFDEYVWSGEVGVVSDPVETEFGFHLVLINDREEDLADATPRLRALLESQNRAAAVQTAFNEAIADAEIVVDAAIGRWDVDFAEVVANEITDAPPITDSLDPADPAGP